MKTKIRNIDDLRAEKARLKNEIQLSRTKMRYSIDAIKEDLSPARHAVDFLGNFLTNRNKGLLNIGVDIGVDTIIRNGILRRSPWPLKVLIPFFLKNYAGNMIHQNKEAIVTKGLDWVREMTDDKPVLTDDNGVYVESRPSFIERALMWVKDVTDEKPQILLKEPLHEDKPSLIERALMWVKDVTDEKPVIIPVTDSQSISVGVTPVRVLSE